ncbi:hypothetical protein EB796_011604 [Bugula neritina]|uniref:Dynein heavy chain hydrolytic ATP-binding dynein motor region domain-containing protein n=1 Tax=Bugula neritina TaxID=10212 RepID=A0A7J7JWN7_BUGNE|nr:hypothetical protein EB796_011604 [Bugula neritina]
MTIAPAIYEVDEEEDQEIVDMLLTNEHTPREPRLITTPPPKVTRKKMKYVNQRQQRDEDSRKTPHWNPVGPGPGTRQDRYGGNKFKGTPNPLTSYARIEHALVGQSLLEIIGPRLQGETIIKDVFSSLPVPPEPKTASARAKNVDIEAAIESQAAEKGLVPHKPWMEKCLQLYAVSTVCQGVILVGPSGSGKSACVQSLIEALCINPRGMSRQSQSQSKVTGAQQADANHRLLKINPCVVDDYQTMFGYLNQQGDWVDGIFTHTFRKANRNVSTTWISMDGPLTATWADNLNSVLDSDRMLHLKNGDKLALSESVKFLFETDDLAAASPSTLCRCVLQKAFNKTVDPVSQFVINEAK